MRPKNNKTTHAHTVLSLSILVRILFSLSQNSVRSEHRYKSKFLLRICVADTTIKKQSTNHNNRLQATLSPEYFGHKIKWVTFISDNKNGITEQRNRERNKTAWTKFAHKIAPKNFSVSWFLQNKRIITRLFFLHCQCILIRKPKDDANTHSNWRTRNRNELGTTFKWMLLLSTNWY